MLTLYLGVLLFGGTHLFSMFFPSARNQLKEKLGESPYKGLYSILSLIGLVLLGWGYWQVRSGDGGSGNFYEPLPWARHLTMLLVLAGFILIFSNQSKGYIHKIVQHPFSAGIGLWSLGHLLANGEKSVVVIFSLFLVLSILDIGFSTARGKTAVHTPSFGRDVRSIVVGVVLYLVFLFGFHPYVLHVPVL
jgi:uncharacterized membrane protein